MDIRDCISINEACQMLDTYDRLFCAMAKRRGIEVVRRGRARYVTKKDARSLRPDIEAFKNRIRISRVLEASA